MFIIFGTIIILLIIFFWHTIYLTISSLTSNANNYIYTGNLWFVSLLIINLILITFILAFYYYKSNLQGKQGPSGNKGFTGLDGSGCVFSSGCNTTTKGF
jgi:hypothetical protein